MNRFIALPPAACDAHVHVFLPAQFPYAASRSYTPASASVEELLTLHRALGVERTVLVQPSVYGTDNRCLCAALAALGPDRARGIAVVDPLRVTESELEVLHTAGVRGIRLNLQVGGEDAGRAQALVAASARVVRRPGWCLQVHAGMAVIVGLLDDLVRLEAPVVLDHFAGGLKPGPGGEERLDRLAAALQRHPLYVKASVPHSLWTGTPAAEPAQLLRRFHQIAPRRVLWGSDWPHTGGSRRGRSPQAIEPFRDVDDAGATQELLAALPDDEARRHVFAANAAALYGFGD